MAYTPTTWTTGDSVTASALNKIENGIANAGGGCVFYEVTSTNCPSSPEILGQFVYLHKVGNNYTIANTLSSYRDSIQMIGNGTLCGFTYSVVPKLDGYYLAFSTSSGVTVTSTSGGISSTPVQVVEAPSAYIITGDFSFTLQGWL